MLPCGLCEERFPSNDDLRVHLEGHASQLFDSSDEESEGNGINDSGQDSDEGSLVLDCVKEEEQVQGQQEEAQGEDFEESSSLAPSEAVEKCRTVREKESFSEVFMCAKCSFKTSRKIHLKRHMKCHLVNHIQEKHEEGDKPKWPEEDFFRITKKKQGNRKKRVYECLKCTFNTVKNTTNPKEWYWTTQDTTNVRNGTKCFFKTLRMYTLKKHIKRVHQKRRDFVCDLCKQTFSVKESITQHMKNIHISAESSTLHKCSFCSYKTHRKSHLKDHVNRVHLKIRKFTCDLCQMKTSSLVNLRQHIERVHVEKNLLSCNRGSNCSYRATEKHDLSRHIRRVHEKFKGFSCEICGKWYSRREGFYSHKRTHLTIGVSITNRVTCDLCQFTTKSRDCMYGHMKRMHLKRIG